MAAKLAISNIAWPVEFNEEILEILGRHDVRDLEIAPSKIWSRPHKVSPSEARQYKNDLARKGFRIVAAQALLFGRPDLTIFKQAETTRQTLEYLKVIIELCAELGAQALVFGSPKNRRIGDLPPEQVTCLAESFFGTLAEYAERAGTAIVLEANPPEYEADFVTRAQEAAALVRTVDRPGLRLHLDTACMSMVGDNIDRIFRDHQPLVHHFHISEPWLAPVDTATVDHIRFAKCLRTNGYDRWISIEMRCPEPFSTSIIDGTVAWARRVYLADEVNYN